VDNRGATSIIAYDSAGNALRQWSKRGARYIEQAAVDVAAQTVTFTGQDGATVVMTWDELRGPGSEPVTFPAAPSKKQLAE
jgi:hypothetical protein